MAGARSVQVSELPRKSLRAIVTSVLGVLVLGVLVAAQDREAPDRMTDGRGTVGPLSDIIAFSLSSPSDGGMKVDISTDGNVLSFFSPNSPTNAAIGQYEHFAGDPDGYVLCYTNPGGSDINAYSLQFSDSGFGPATVTAPTVTRTTTDGLLELKQTFTLTGAKKSLTIKSTIRNRSAAPVRNITFRRHAKFNADKGGAHGWATFNSNWHLNTSKDGVVSQNVPADAPVGRDAHGMAMLHSTGSFARAAKFVFLITDVSCDPPAIAGPFQGDRASTIQYAVGTINPGASKTIVLSYNRY